MNFTITELCQSNTAKALKIDNTPKQLYIYENLFNLIVECLQPIRDKLQKPIIISSGYRCEKLNKAVRGVANSHHQIGTCADIVVNGLTSKQLFDFIIKKKFKFTQLIEEYANGKTWVHIEYNKSNLKCEKLKYVNGKYIGVKDALKH